MKGDILLKALEILKEQTMSQVDFIDAVLSSGYGASMNEMNFQFKKNQKNRKDKNIRSDNIIERKKRLYVFISKMKRDGLIEEKFKDGKDGDKFSLSTKGNIKLSQLKNRLPSKYYKKEIQNSSIIISFDIPERLRRKRDWIREVIRNLGFEMVHQSVWIGNVKIPKVFILDLENLNILEYVEIFEITKSGTLKKLGK